MTDDLRPPAPVPPECNLRGMQFMPLDVQRLLDSELFITSTGDEFKAAVALWCKAWMQVPASSLPDDERTLAFYSGAGSKWTRVRAMAMRGWFKAADGRLYHHVVAEKALDAWKSRLNQQERTRAAREKRGSNRAHTPTVTESVTENVTLDDVASKGQLSKGTVKGYSPIPPPGACVGERLLAALQGTGKFPNLVLATVLTELQKFPKADLTDEAIAEMASSAQSAASHVITAPDRWIRSRLSLREAEITKKIETAGGDAPRARSEIVEMDRKWRREHEARVN